MKRWKTLPDFRDAQAVTKESQDELSELTVIEILYGARDDANQQIAPESEDDGHGQWIAFKYDDAYYCIYWKRAAYEGGEVEIDEREEFKNSIEAKQALVKEAEEAAVSTEWGATWHKLEEQFKRWKEIRHFGTPAEKKMWDAFSAARDVFFKNLNAYHEANKQAKEKIVAEAKELAESERWQKATDRLNALLSEWKKLGSAGRNLDDDLWAQFREANDIFFSRKKSHWESLQPAYEEARLQKEALIAKAKELADSTEWKQTTAKMNELMEEWKKTGYAGRTNNDLWAQFHDARGTFFTRRSEYYDSLHKQQKENYEAKKKLLKEAQGIAGGLDFSRENTARMKDLQTEWKAIGSCSRDQENTLWTQFRAAMDQYFDGLRSYTSHRNGDA